MTTIRISKKLQKELKERKLFYWETYEEIIWDLLDSSRTLSKKTKLHLEQSRKDIQEGRFVTLKEVKKRLHLL